MLRQLRTLARFQNREDERRDEGSHKLRQGREYVEDAKVDARELAGGGAGGGVVRAVLEVQGAVGGVAARGELNVGGV